MTNPHDKLQLMAMHLMAMCSQHSSDAESVEDHAKRMDWANSTRAMLGEDFFYDLKVALGQSFSAKSEAPVCKVCEGSGYMPFETNRLDEQRRPCGYCRG